MTNLLTLCLGLMLTALPTYAGDKKPSTPPQLTTVEQLQLQVARLSVDLLRAQSQLAAAPAMCAAGKVVDSAGELAKNIEQAHHVDGYHFDLQSGSFLKNPEPPNPAAPPDVKK